MNAEQLVPTKINIEFNLKPSDKMYRSLNESTK